MTRACALALLLVGLLAGLAGADDFVGPRVTLEGELTLAEAAKAFGRQVGCTVQVPYLEKQRAERRVALALRGASPTAARAELERAYGVTVRRYWRGGYGIEPQPAPVMPALGRPLGGLAQGWTCWLSNVRINFESALRELGPDGLHTDVSLVPRIIIQTPSDAEGLRILACSLPRTTATEEAQPDHRGRDHLIRWNQNGQDPSTWLLEQGMPLPPGGADQLERLCFDVHLLRLVAHRFVFDEIDTPAAQLQSDADMDVTLKPNADQPALAVELSGALPAGGSELFQAATGREGMVDLRLLTNDGQVVPASIVGVNRDSKRDTWTASFQVRRGDRGDQARPSRLELTVYLPTGEVEVQTVEFRNVPLPPLP
ncbi:MAG: hypothetical protein HZB16_22950 [Armatimonadetes bacterium]|nr:hypothetical protein [Armatimonadota bacterium]